MITKITSIPDTARMVLLDFSATWCKPCLVMKPALFDAAIELAPQDIQVFEVDIDDSSELAKQFNIRSVPTLILTMDGKEFGRNSGAISKKQIIEFVNNSLNKVSVNEEITDACSCGHTHGSE